MDLLNKPKITKGALDGSMGVLMRYYTGTLAAVDPSSDMPKMVTKKFRTLEELIDAAEEVLTRNQDTMITLTSHQVSPETYEKVFSDGQAN
jgi:hypothetical protein